LFYTKKPKKREQKKTPKEYGGNLKGQYIRIYPTKDNIIVSIIYDL